MAAETAIGPQRISIEPLDPQRHDRATFSCGTGHLDNFLSRSHPALHECSSVSRRSAMPVPDDTTRAGKESVR